MTRPTDEAGRQARYQVESSGRRAGKTARLLDIAVRVIARDHAQEDTRGLARGERIEGDLPVTYLASDQESIARDLTRMLGIVLTEAQTTEAERAIRRHYREAVEALERGAGR